MDVFGRNYLKGVPNELNIACIKDEEAVWSVLGSSENKVKPYDGAIFGHPCMAYLENASLGGKTQQLGSIKPFTHFYIESLNIAGIIKCAEYPITNDKIRRSFDRAAYIVQQMMDHRWVAEQTNEYGEDILLTLDITKRYDGRRIVFDEPIYFEHNNKYYLITDIKSLGNNQYKRTIYEVDRYGGNRRFLNSEELASLGIQENMLVDTNYKIW